MSNSNHDPIDKAKQNVSEAIHQGKKAAKKGYEEACDMHNKTCNKMTNCVKEKPMARLMLAMLVGAVMHMCCASRKTCK